MKRLILLIVLLIIIGGAWYAYKLYTGKVPSLTQKKADVTISAAGLIAAFDKDSAAATRQYMGKVLQVNGNIKSVEKEAGTLFLGTANSMSTVHCSMDSVFVKQLAALNPGHAI